MTVRLSDTTRNARVQAVIDKIDGGAGPGTVKVYTGAQPATPATAASGTLLLEFTLSDPSFAAPASGTAALDVDPIPADQALANGNPGWARFADSNGNAVMDVTVGTSGADLTVNAASVTTGQDVEITSLSITDPA